MVKRSHLQYHRVSVDPGGPVKYLIVVLLLVASAPTWAAGKLRILLTNDDGFDAPGIKAVHASLVAAGHDVYLIAPATQQSGASASITSGGVEVTIHPDNTWAVLGKPADAVRFGLEDYDYWMRINQHFEIHHLDSEAILYRYRVHDNSLNARAR